MGEWRGCSGLNRHGDPCGAVPIKGSDRCARHSMSDEEWHAQSIRGGKRRAANARERADIRESERTTRRQIPEAKLARALEVIHDLLDATIPGSSEPNYEARAFGVFLAAEFFRLGPSQRPEVIALLAQIRPKLVHDPQVHRLLDLDQARARLIEAYESGRITIEELPAGVLEVATSAR